VLITLLLIIHGRLIEEYLNLSDRSSLKGVNKVTNSQVEYKSNIGYCDAKFKYKYNILNCTNTTNVMLFSGKPECIEFCRTHVLDVLKKLIMSLTYGINMTTSLGHHHFLEKMIIGIDTKNQYYEYKIDVSKNAKHTLVGIQPRDHFISRKILHLGRHVSYIFEKKSFQNNITESESNIIFTIKPDHRLKPGLSSRNYVKTLLVHPGDADKPIDLIHYSDKVERGRNHQNILQITFNV
jgi:hypothetical protein